MKIVGTIETEVDLAEARPDTVVLDGDGDVLFMGRDGKWHYLSDVHERHDVPCHLPAEVLRPDPRILGFETHCFAEEGCSETLSGEGSWPMPPLLFQWLHSLGWGVAEDKLLCPAHLKALP